MTLTSCGPGQGPFLVEAGLIHIDMAQMRKTQDEVRMDETKGIIICSADLKTLFAKLQGLFEFPDLNESNSVRRLFSYHLSPRGGMPPWCPHQSAIEAMRFSPRSPKCSLYSSPLRFIIFLLIGWTVASFIPIGDLTAATIVCEPSRGSSAVSAVKRLAALIPPAYLSSYCGAETFRLVPLSHASMQQRRH